MGKLSIKRARERSGADPKRVATREAAISQTFPGGVAPEIIGEFIRAATAATKNYLDSLPMGRPKPRQHRATIKQTHPARAHRPADELRHGLIGDLYDAYMGTRNDDIEARGFKRTVDAVLTAAGLPLLSEREQRRIREQIKIFANIEGAAEDHDKPT